MGQFQKKSQKPWLAIGLCTLFSSAALLGVTAGVAAQDKTEAASPSEKAQKTEKKIVKKIRPIVVQEGEETSEKSGRKTVKIITDIDGDYDVELLEGDNLRWHEGVAAPHAPTGVPDRPLAMFFEYKTEKASEALEKSIAILDEKIGRTKDKKAKAALSEAKESLEASLKELADEQEKFKNLDDKLAKAKQHRMIVLEKSGRHRRGQDGELRWKVQREILEEDRAHMEEDRAHMLEELAIARAQIQEAIGDVDVEISENGAVKSLFLRSKSPEDQEEALERAEESQLEKLEHMAARLEARQARLEARMEERRARLEERLKAERTRLEAEKKAEYTRLEAEKKAERTRLEAEKKAEYTRLEAEKKAEHTRLEAEEKKKKEPKN